VVQVEAGPAALLHGLAAGATAALRVKPDLGYINQDTVKEVLNLHRSGRAERSFQLWNILNLSVWFDHWIAGRDPVQA